MDYAYSRSCADTAAFALLVEGWNELVQEGFTPDGLAVCPVTAECECLYAYRSDDDIIGAIAYRYMPDTNSVAIVHAYVEPSSRKRGVFRGLVDALKQRSADEGLSAVYMAVTFRNPTAEAVLQKVGTPHETKFSLWRKG